MRQIEIKGIGKALKKQPYKKPGAVKELEQVANDEARKNNPTCPHLGPRTTMFDSLEI